MGSWERGRSWVCEWRERKLVLGALKWGGHRSGGGLGLLVWWPRAEGRAPLEGGKGNRPRGGCRETQEAPAPPPTQAQREAVGSWGGRALGQLQTCGGGGLGHREKAIGSQATRVSVPQCVCSGSGEARTRRWWQERREGKEGSCCRSLDVVCTGSLGGGGDPGAGLGDGGLSITAPDPGHSQSLRKWEQWTQGRLGRKLTHWPHVWEQRPHSPC